MKLRGRFTLTLALAALLPISVAAFVTRQVIADTLRTEYKETRLTAEHQIDREIARVSTQVTEATGSLASQQHPFVGGILRDVIKGQLDADNLKKLREQGGPMMRAISLDMLTITGPDDAVLISPHFRAAAGEPMPIVRQRATATGGKAYFVRDKVRTGPAIETILFAQAAQITRDQGYTVAVLAGRKITDEMLSTVRRSKRADARIVSPRGELLLAPSKNWDALTSAEPPIRKPLLGPDNTPVAFVEVAVSDNNLDAVLRKITFLSASLALAALGVVVLIGLFVARRMARDLDLLVEGSLAASRGDLDHRVPVRSKDEFGAVAAAFNFMMEDLRTSKDRLVIAERIAAWQDIARRLAHEIKNPLTPIQMAMDTLRKTWKKQHPKFDEILEESTSTVLEEADRLKHIVTEFSDFARMPKPNFQRLDLNEVVRSAMALYHGAVPIEPHLSAKLPQLDADKGQMTQVILNLVENARDAIGARTNGKITLSTKLGEAGDRAVFTVEDNGPGVPKEVKERVFTPYFTTKHAKGGSGLGLAIVHRIVSDHGGRIVLTDVRGGGARFTIELPLRNGTALMASRI